MYLRFNTVEFLPIVPCTVIAYLPNNTTINLGQFEALWDTGCQMSVVHKNLLPLNLQGEDQLDADIAIGQYRAVSTLVRVSERLPNNSSLLILANSRLFNA
jgi:hypothetical protein